MRLLFVLTLCTSLEAKEGVPTLRKVEAPLETPPETILYDGIDDPAFWFHEKEPLSSRILVTNKNGGLLIYNLRGEKVSEYRDFAYNNVDLRGHLVVATLTGGKSGFQILRMNPLSLEPEALTQLIAAKNIDPYGICLYQNLRSQKVYAFLTGRYQDVEQFEIDGHNARYVRTLRIASKNEGCVVDDEYDTLYVAEESKGLWKFDARPDGREEGHLLADLAAGEPHLKEDLEGVALYNDQHGGGFIAVSVQGLNQFALFDRRTAAYLRSFQIFGPRGAADLVTESDGIEIFSQGIAGTIFGRGMLMAQDDEAGRDEFGNKQQNIKLVPIERIVEAQ